jgi:hypothetical protein
MKGQTLSRRLVLAVALVPLAAAGCEPEAVRFNNTIAAYNRRLNDAGKQFVQDVGSARQAKGLDADRLWASYDRLRETVKEVKQEFAALEVPPGPSAKRLAEGYAKFLRSQDQMVLNELSRIMRLAQRAGGSGSANPEIMRLLLEMQRREKRDLAELQQLQREFAREHKIALLAPR